MPKFHHLILPKTILKEEITPSLISGINAKLIRFHLKKESHIWLKPSEVLFAESADHYVRVLVQIGNKKKWVIRHCTLKELLMLLPIDCFKRINRFYVVNLWRLSSVEEEQKSLCFDGDFNITLSHSISPYIMAMLSF